MDLSTKKKKTKQEYFALMDFLRNVLEVESIILPYDFEYSLLPDFEMTFYKFLDINHYLTLEQKSVILNLLRDNLLYNINDFMDVLIKDYCTDYDDVSTLNIVQFESILCHFFEKHQDFANSILEDITNDISNVNWSYLLKCVPDIKYEEPPIQNDEYRIKLKDLNYMKSAIESLENLTNEEDKITKDIIETLKKIIDRIT